MANYNFRKDLIIGEQGESVVVGFLIEQGCEYLYSNKDNKFDVMMLKHDKEVTYEIKTDIFCLPKNDTGNLFVEYMCRGKKSGISVTQADWFVTYFKYLGELWFIKTDKLKKLISQNNFKTVGNAGDVGSKTHGYLLNRKAVKEHFHVVKYK